MKYKYNGITLPKLPEWDKQTYPYAFIQFGDMTGYSIYSLIVTNAKGVMGESYRIGEHTTCEWVVAADEESEANLSGTNPGISTDNWLQYENAKTYTEYGYTNVVWSDFDILKADNTVYLAASDPVPVYDMSIFWDGLSLGLCGKALPWKAEPVAWLYNGVRLPKLPKWDIEAYPYAFIESSTGGVLANFVVSSMPLFGKDYENLFLKYKAMYSKTDGTALRYTYDSINTQEEYRTGFVYQDRKECTDGTRVSYSIGTNLLWANYDVIAYDDDSVYLAASEPIPVYE